ncbi:hypothetical protein AX16_002855 [Volvariella volvacea WC 439]|nr:hypothetical protein AX16_002855 [Volvariella volvacea WC 439]
MAATASSDHLQLVLAQTKQAEGLSASRAESTTKARSATVVLNTVVVFQAGFDAEFKKKLLQGLLTTAANAASKTELDSWEKSFTEGTESSWVAGHFTAAPTPLSTLPGVPVRSAVEQYLLEHLNPKQAADIKATFEALHLATNATPNQLLNAAAIRSKDASGTISSANFIISILSLSPGGRVILNAWRFAYELKASDLLGAHEGSVAGLNVVPLELEIDPAKYEQAKLEGGLSEQVHPDHLIKDITLPPSTTGHPDEHDELAKWADANITPDGHVILLSAPSTPGVYPFDITLFFALNISGNVDVNTLSLEVRASITIPIKGKVQLGGIKGDLKQGIVLNFNVWAAKGNLRFFLEAKFLKVTVDVSSLIGSWNKTISLIPLPI